MATRTYTIEKGLIAVEKLVIWDVNPKNVRIMLGITQKWRSLMKQVYVDEGRVVEFLTLDTYAMREASIEGSPLYEMRSIDQYHCWIAVEAYLQEAYGMRFFDLCAEA